ncbi:hypothetical protein B0H13DRAFT_684852 [Mycena leptocephala]|nr:hypothetical protein B0H13DRAFT_684852 [Mycena leptocephala]
MYPNQGGLDSTSWSSAVAQAFGLRDSSSLYVWAGVALASFVLFLVVFVHHSRPQAPISATPAAPSLGHSSNTQTLGNSTASSLAKTLARRYYLGFTFQALRPRDHIGFCSPRPRYSRSFLFRTSRLPEMEMPADLLLYSGVDSTITGHDGAT